MVTKRVDKHKHKILAGFLTSLVLIMLLIAGPVEAFILELEIDNPEVEKGEIIDFTVSVEVEDREILGIDHLILKLTGPQNIECKFYPNGTIISGCLGITITQTSTTSYGYGYGYGYGFEKGILEYEITLDTSYYSSGVYESSLIMTIGNDMFGQSGEDVIIKLPAKELEGCSLRSRKTDLIAGSQNFGEGRISFYIPVRDSANGEGSISAQKGRERFSYKFDVVDIIENYNDYARIRVYGRYKIGRGDEKAEEAIITFDKTNNKISLSSTNIDIQDSEIFFRRRC